MTHWLEKNLRQTCIYWSAPVSDGRGGYTFADPVELSCRWIDSTRIVTSSTGKEELVQASVQVAQDVDEQGMLLLGELADLDSDQLSDPVDAGASEIKAFKKIPTVDGRAYLRKAFVFGSMMRRIRG